MSKYLIAGNWKMNTDVKQGIALCRDVKKLFEDNEYSEVDLLICPPFTHLYALNQITNDSHIYLGAQNISNEDQGAFTGEISAGMIKSTGADFVIIGHSERRNKLDESDKILNEKLKKSTDANLNSIFCIGESLTQREKTETINVLKSQLDSGLDNFNNHKLLTIAYEPVWAIGTGKSAEVSQIEEVHNFIREYIDKRYPDNEIKILYGGSLKSKNAEDILSVNNVDGGLIGGASLKADEFIEIYKVATELI